MPDQPNLHTPYIVTTETRSACDYTRDLISSVVERIRMSDFVFCDHPHHHYPGLHTHIQSQEIEGDPFSLHCYELDERVSVISSIVIPEFIHIKLQ